MSVLLMTYDLNAERHKKGDYNGLYKVRDSYDFMKLSESSYALNTNEQPAVVYERVRQYLDGNDSLYIIQLHKPVAGQGNDATNNWLVTNLRTC